MSLAEVEAVELTIERTDEAGGRWSEAWQRLRRNPSAIVGAGLVLTFVVVAVFA